MVKCSAWKINTELIASGRGRCDISVEGRISIGLIASRRRRHVDSVEVRNLPRSLNRVKLNCGLTTLLFIM